MEKLSNAEKARAYDEALKMAKSWYIDAQLDFKKSLETLFPELKESEDDRIRKWIIGILSTYEHDRDFRNAAIDWLEKQDEQKYTKKDVDDAYLKGVCNTKQELKKQGEQKPANKVEPKFHEGDWAVSNLDGKARQISEVHFDEYNSYYVVEGECVNLEEYDRLHHLWSIQDAKDGDILSWDNERYTIIFKELENQKTIVAYCSYNSHDDSFAVSGYNTKFDVDLKFRPASEGAKKALLKKIVNSDYHWDPDSLELSKMPEYNPELWDNTDKDMARFIGNAITTDEAIAYLREKHIEVIDAHAWLESLKDRVNSNRGVDSEQCNALMQTIANSKIMSSKDARLLMNLHDRLTAE